MPIKIIGGTEFDGSCSFLTIGKTPIPIISSSYGDNVETEFVYETGSQMPEAETPGQYKPADGKIKVRSTVFRAIIMPNLPQWGAANVHTIAVMSYVHKDIGSDSDALHWFRILGGSAAVEASAKALEIELTVKYRWVAWTSKRRVFGNHNGGSASGRLTL